jgi:hypothetical protein
MNQTMPNISDRNVQKILLLPLFLVNLYIGISLALFVISPMFAVARNAVWSVTYGVMAMLCFSLGFRWAAYAALPSHGRANPAKFTLNIAITMMCLANLIYFLPLLRLAIAYYGFGGFFDVFSDLGGNYHTKDALMEDVGYASLGFVYTILNLAAFSQVAPYALLLFCREKLHPATLAAVALSTLVTVFFYLSIGTMSGIFYIVLLIASGWLVKQFLFSMDSRVTILVAPSKRRMILLAMGSMGSLFFAFMVFSLSSRMDSNSVINMPFLYEYDSPIYSLLGRRLGDGFGMALSYVSQGWYGLGNSLSMDFKWTEFQSFSRVLASYLTRFSGDESGLLPLSYPVRQEPITGYSAYAHWHTIFPWFASDFTFAGTLLITGGLGAVYGATWVKAIREGCLINTVLFAKLTIGAFFINANSQILDNKPLTLSLLGLIIMLPFRRKIGGIS